MKCPTRRQGKTISINRDRSRVSDDDAEEEVIYKPPPHWKCACRSLSQPNRIRWLQEVGGNVEEGICAAGPDLPPPRPPPNFRSEAPKNFRFKFLPDPVALVESELLHFFSQMVKFLGVLKWKQHDEAVFHPPPPPPKCWWNFLRPESVKIIYKNNQWFMSL